MTEEWVSMLVKGILEDRFGGKLDGEVVSSFWYSGKRGMPSFVSVRMECALVRRGGSAKVLASCSANGRRGQEDSLREEAAALLVRKIASMDPKEVLP